MNTITKNKLLFIDHYLENSGVEYADIRAEMTDHVASALETQDGDFYENFKTYMLAHKQELLNNNKHFKRLATKRAFKVVGKMLIKPWFLALPSAVVYVSFYFARTMAVYDVSYYLELIYFALFFLSLIPHLRSISGTKKKFSLASKIISAPGLVLYFLHNILKPFRFDGNAWVSFVFFALMITIAAAIVVSVYSLNRKYRLQYQ